MSRTPARVSERKMIQVGSIWTNGSTDVRVMHVQVFGDYRYIVYRVVGQTYKRPKDVNPTFAQPYYETPLDDHTFSLRFDAKIVRKDAVKAAELVRTTEDQSGKVKSVGWV